MLPPSPAFIEPLYSVVRRRMLWDREEAGWLNGGSGPTGVKVRRLGSGAASGAAVARPPARARQPRQGPRQHAPAWGDLEAPQRGERFRQAGATDLAPHLGRAR